jgi:predicted O-methyltransferase YrrM
MKMQEMKLTPQALIEKKSINLLLQELKLLKKARAEASVKKIPIIDDSTGYFLSIICLLCKPENILEIGCGTGYSTYFILRHLDHRFHYTGIDLNKERILEAKIFIDKVFKSKNFFRGEIEFINGNAIKLIPDLNQEFDLVFIDAAKYQYLEYIKSVLNKLKKDGLIIADNIFYSNKIFKKKISNHDHNSVMGLRKYINYISSNAIFNNNYFNIGDGLVVSKYKGINKKIKNNE